MVNIVLYNSSGCELARVACEDDTTVIRNALVKLVCEGAPMAGDRYVIEYCYND